MNVFGDPGTENRARSSLLFLIVFAVGLISAIIGSVMVFGTSGPLHERVILSAWSVLSLYVVDPMLDNEVGPFPYEIARWAAPATTAIGIFKVFESFFFHLRQRMRSLGKDHITILGTSESVHTLISSLKDDGYRGRIQVAVSAASDPVEIERLQAAGVVVRALDYSRAGSEEFDRAVRDLDLDDAEALVSFESEPGSFGHLRAISTALDVEEPVRVYVESVDSRMKNLIEKEMDSYENIDVRYFSILELVGASLIEMPTFDVFPRIPAEPQPQPGSYKDVAEHITPPNILLVGFGQLGQDLLMQLANQSTVNPIYNPRITIVDRDVHKLWEGFEARRPMIERVLDTERLAMNIESREFEGMVAARSAEDPFTSVIYAQSDTQESLLSVDFLAGWFSSSEVAIYAASHVDHDALSSAIERHHLDITFFGEVEDVINPQVIFNEALSMGAKRFNAAYMEVASELGGGRATKVDVESAWHELSTLKKESSLYQTAHGRTKHWLLEIIARDYTGTSVSEILDSWREKMDGLSIAEQIDVIEADPLMNFMTAVEHKRWSNFYYMRGFEYGPKDEQRRRHSSLIDDWDEFLVTLRDQVIYDFISVLMVEPRDSQIAGAKTLGGRIVNETGQ